MHLNIMAAPVHEAGRTHYAPIAEVADERRVLRQHNAYRRLDVRPQFVASAEHQVSLYAPTLSPYYEILPRFSRNVPGPASTTDSRCAPSVSISVSSPGESA